MFTFSYISCFSHISSIPAIFSIYISGVVFSLNFMLFLYFLFFLFQFLVYFKYFLLWLVFLYFYYYLHSSFIYFLKKYSFSKFTGGVKRYWRRVFSIFWSIECCWFLVFIFCFVNASYEPTLSEEIYMYKSKFIIFFEKFFFDQFRLLYLVLFFSVSIYFCFNTISQLCIYFIIFYLCFLYFFFLECSSFCYIVSFFYEYSSVFYFDKSFFYKLFDYPRFRPRVAFLSILSIIRFWHILVILGSIIILIYKLLYINKFFFSFYSFTIQNMFVYYIMFLLSFGLLLKFFFKIYMRLFWFWFLKTPFIILNYIL